MDFSKAIDNELKILAEMYLQNEAEFIKLGQKPPPRSQAVQKILKDVASKPYERKVPV